MIANKSGGKRRGSNTGRMSKNTFVTKSGQTIKVNRSLGDKIRARQAAYAQKRAERLAGMPKNPVKRFFYRLHPKRLYKYWFSREGGIMALKIFGIGALAGCLLLLGVFAYFRKDLPNIRDVSGNNIGGSIQYYDRTGQTLLWEDHEAVKRIPVPGDQISDYVKKATIAIEDKDFFKHGGFDVRGIMRAGFNNVFGTTGGTQGGSTITQQLVKLTQDWSNDKTYTRKVKELILSVELEREYSKEEILTGYLNTAPYGGVDYGVEAASRDYFDKSAKDLTLDEAVMLAAIPQSPSYYSPFPANKANFNREALVGRMHHVLNLMHEQGMITKEQREEAKKVDVTAKIKPSKQRYEGIKAPWFVLTAKNELNRRKGAETVKRGGWKVTTTLDLEAQKVAEDVVAKGIAQVKRQGGDTAGFVAEDVTTGQVVALVGGVDFNDPNFGQNNYAREKLPPGSTFKAYDYAALIDTQKNVGAGSVLYDIKGPVPGYPCTTAPTRTGNCLTNYDLRYPGPLTLRYSLGGSRNVPAIKAMLIAGVDETIDLAHRLMTTYTSDGKPDPTIGTYKCYYDERYEQEAPCYASSGIGDGAYLHLDEHVHGYATLSRNGLNLPQTYILKITDANGKVLDEWKPTKGHQAINAETAYIVSDMLSDPNASYMSRKQHRHKGWEFGIKTGTTNDNKDGLMMMMSTKYAAGVWVGYHNRQKVMSGFMESMTQPIVGTWMQTMHDKLQPVKRVKPSGIQTLPAYVVRNHVGVSSVEPSTSTDLFPSWYKKTARQSSDQKIDQVSNKLATECTPDRAIKAGGNANSNDFSVDKFVDGGGAANTSEKDDIHQCSDAKPSITLQQIGTSLVATVSGGTHPLSSDQFQGAVNFLVDGQIVNSAAVSDSNIIATFIPDDSYSGKTFTAEVIDSVLYDAQSNSVVFSGSGGGGDPGAPVLSTGNLGPPNIVFNWTATTPLYTLYRNNIAVASCTLRPTTSCNVPASAGTYYLLDGSGKKSNNVVVN